MSLIKKLAGETAIYGVSSILGRLLNYVILAPYFTRIFEPGAYGVVSDLYAHAALLMVLFTYRMETAFFRFGSKKEDLNRTFSTASISIIFSTLLFVGVLIYWAEPVAAMLEYESHPDYVIWFTLIIAFDTLAAIPFAKLRLENRPIRFAVIKILNILINIVFIFFFLEGCPWLIEQGWTGIESIYNADNRIAYVFISNLLASTVVMLLLIPEYFKIRLQLDVELWKKMMWYALPLIVVGIAGVINQLVSIPMLKERLTFSVDENLYQAGVYAACVKLAILMSLFIQAFNYAAEPFFFRNAERDDAKAIYAQVGQAFALVGSLVFLGIMLFLDLVQYIIGQDYREGLGVVPILLLAFLFLGLYYNFSIWYKLKDRTIFGTYISVGGAIITLAINFFLIPVWGYYASAWAALACYLFMAAASYWTGQKYYPIQYPIFKMSIYIFLAIGAYFVGATMRPWFDENLWLILPFNTLIFISYLLFVYKMEQQTIKQLL